MFEIFRHSSVRVLLLLLLFLGAGDAYAQKESKLFPSVEMPFEGELTRHDIGQMFLSNEPAVYMLWGLAAGLALSAASLLALFFRRRRLARTLLAIAFIPFISVGYILFTL